MTVIDDDEHIRRAMSEVSNEVARFSYALFGIDTQDRPDLYASCVLLKCDEIPVLVTAAHAISEIEKNGRGVYVGGAKHLRQVPGQFKRSSEDGNDRLDIAAIVLPPELMRQEEMEALPLSRTTLNGFIPSTHFRCVHGYPCSKNKQQKQIDPMKKIFTKYHFTYAGVSPEPGNYRGLRKDAAFHVALRYRRGKNEKGNRGTPPNPIGMSGGGLWMIPNLFAAGLLSGGDRD
jgi:hypothetical protein